MPAPASESRTVAREPLPSGIVKPSSVSRHQLFHSVLKFAASLIDVSPWELLITVILLTLTSLTEGRGVALLFPILQIAGLNMTNEGHVGHYTAEVQNLLRHSSLRPS